MTSFSSLHENTVGGHFYSNFQRCACQVLRYCSLVWSIGQIPVWCNGENSFTEHAHVHTLIIRPLVPSCFDLKPYCLRVRQSLLVGSHVFRVGVGEAEELVLVQVHYDKFVCWGQVDRHLGELFVKVASVPAVPLQGERRLV